MAATKPKAKPKTKTRERQKSFAEAEHSWPFALHLKCSACGGSYHEVTTEFRYGQTYNGAMFKLHRQYGPLGENWQSFPQDPAVMGDCLVCPNCDVPYMEISNNLYWDEQLTKKFDPDDLIPDEITELEAPDAKK